MYSQGDFHGTNDIALVKTKEPIIFVPGKVMPVRHFKYFATSMHQTPCLLVQVCLKKVSEEGQDVVVTGFGYSGRVDEDSGNIDCWTDEKGPSRFVR